MVFVALGVVFQSPGRQDRQGSGRVPSFLLTARVTKNDKKASSFFLAHLAHLTHLSVDTALPLSLHVFLFCQPEGNEKK